MAKRQRKQKTTQPATPKVREVIVPATATPSAPKPTTAEAVSESTTRRSGRNSEIPDDYTQNLRDLRRIFVLSAILTTGLIALSFVLR